jgi:surface protein
VAQAQEPYAALSDDNTVLTFYYDDQKESRNGLGVGPFYYARDLSWADAKSSVTNVVFDNSFANCTSITSTAYWFYALTNLTTITGIENLKTDNVTDMKYMFYATGLTSLDLSGFNTENVTNMARMFDACSNLTSLDISHLNTANVTNMEYMFSRCGLTSLDMSHLNTVNVMSMEGMFDDCSDLTSLDMSGINITNVTNMSYMFYECSSLTNLDLSGINTANVTNMKGMFAWCSSLTSLDLSGFNTENVTDMGGMFDMCEKLTSLDVSHFNTANVTDMGSMFFGCYYLTSLDLSNFNTAKVTNMKDMFDSCTSLTSLDLSHFNTDNVTDMTRMFLTCDDLTSLDLCNFNTANVTSMEDMFRGCSGLTSLDVSSFNTANVTNMEYMFYNCSNLTSIDVSKFNTANVTNMESMFERCSSLTSLDLSNFNTANVTNMGSMFLFCSNLTTIYVGQDWSTANVTDGNSMFSLCYALKGGAGTLLDSDHTDYSYARIDGGPDSQTPGYFTELSSYGLTVADVRVTSLNASAITGDNITGTVSFNPSSRTLTLNKATINGCIYSYGDLTIDLKGENTITATDTCAIKNTDPTAMHNLTFKSTDGTGSLKINPWAYLLFEGFNEPSLEDGIEVILGDLSGGGTTVIKSIKYYDLWIGDTQVTEKNCSDILDDANASQTGTGSFQYVPSLNKLFITNNTDNLRIETKDPEGLIVYLAPRSANAVNSIVYTGNDNAKLTITTDGNYPGAISLSANANVISGFSDLILEQNLVIMEPEDAAYDNNGKRLAATSATISAPLSPITEGKTIQPDGNELQPEQGNDVNKVVDDILYTLGNANNAAGDGYDDDGFIVINSVTTDQQATEAAQNYAPGSDEYLDRFKGLTFMVPAGSGDIEFDMQTLEGYAMKVMIGDATPVIVEQAEKGIYKIPYNVSEPTYVYAYNAGKIGEANGARGVQKGKKTTVYIKIYTVGVNPKKVKSANPAGQASGGEYQGKTPEQGQDIESEAEIEARMGDVNGDEAINAADIAETINAIMGRHSGVFDKTAADLNGDGVINAADIVIIVNKIMTK